jgi:hypothetical protein
MALTFENFIFWPRFNALERLHTYVTSNFEERNSSSWHAIKEEFEGGDGGDAAGDSGALPVIPYRSLQAIGIHRETHIRMYVRTYIRIPGESVCTYMFIPGDIVRDKCANSSRVIQRKA